MRIRGPGAAERPAGLTRPSGPPPPGGRPRSGGLPATAGHRAARTAAYLAALTAAALLTATAPAAAAPGTPAVPGRAGHAAPGNLSVLSGRAARAGHPGRAAPLTRAWPASLCRRYQHVIVAAGRGRGLVVKNDNYGGGTECLTVPGGRPSFTVTRSPVPAWHAKPQAYPFILRGCSWGTCSPDSGLPRQVATLTRPVATWSTTQVPHGRWDAAFDIWFGRRPLTTGQAGGAELMIWLNARHVKLPRRARAVTVGQARWYLAQWRACHLGTCWNYIQFRAVRPVTAVRRLLLLPFIAMAGRRGLIEPQWYPENIEAGFELWQGGTGLATNWFWARP